MPDSKSKTAAFANKAGVVRGLLTELLRGEWQAANRLTEAMACERFAVSRTPVREAFLELQGLGLLEMRRNCGAVVLPFGVKQLGDIYAVRSLMEVEAARLAASHANTEQVEALIAEFEAIHESGGIDPDWRHDRSLHTFIAESSGNTRLATEIARYANLIQSIREIVGEQTMGIHRTTAEEHLTILRALRARRPQISARAMAAHLDQATQSALRAMKTMRRKETNNQPPISAG